jgi:uncharacterized protein
MIKNKLATLSFLVFTLLVFTGIAASQAVAQTAEDLRQSGAAGERYDGFMEARTASAKSAVDSINAKRRSLYESRAQELGVSVDQVGQIYAKEILQKAAPGTWFFDSTSQWKQK